jgi:hypothetical protein
MMEAAGLSAHSVQAEQPLVGVLLEADPPSGPVESTHSRMLRLQQKAVNNAFAHRATRSQQTG